MVITSYHPIVGGAEKQLAQLVARMVRLGHQVTVITRHHPGLSQDEILDGARLLRIRSKGPKPLAALGFLAGAARAIRKARPEVIHCHSLFSPALAGMIAGALLKVPVIAKPMCGFEATQIAAKPFGRLRMALTARRLTRAVVISSEIEQELAALGFAPGQMVRIPNGVDARLFAPAPDRAALRARIGQTHGLPDGTWLVFAGRLVPQKRLPLLLAAWAEVAPLQPQAQLLIAGANRKDALGGNVDRAHAGSGADPLFDQPQVHFLGNVDHMPDLLAAADGFVLPSAREGLSNALLEACSAGLPVVATRIGGTVDVIHDGQNGLLFEVDDLAGLKRQLLRLLSDADLRIRLGTAARETVLARFDIDGTADRLLALYQALASTRGSA